MTFSTTTPAIRRASSLAALAGLLIATLSTSARAQPALPDAIAEPGAVVVMTAHAVGAQIYGCVADATGKPAWQFREPIASLMIDGRTVGRHFAGPSWELADGSLVMGKVAGHAPGATAADVAWLKLEATAGRGQFATVTTIQRINTRGGALTGTCDTVGQLTAVPYSADYVFLSKAH